MSAQRCCRCANLKRGQVNWCRARGMALKDGYMRRDNECLLYERGQQAAYDAGRRRAVELDKALYEGRMRRNAS